MGKTEDAIAMALAEKGLLLDDQGNMLQRKSPGIGVRHLRVTQAKRLLLGYMLQTRQAAAFIENNIQTIDPDKRDEYKKECWQRVRDAVYYQTFRQDDLRYLVGRLALLQAYRVRRGGGVRRGDTEG